MFYIAIFFVSILLCYIAELAFDRFKAISIIFILFATLVVSVIGGYRDINIGTDTQLYGEFVFNYSKNFFKFIDFYNYSYGGFKMEYGYMFLNYLVSRFSDSSNDFYFILSFLTQLFFIMSFFNLKSKLSPTLAWFTYLFLFYGTTLNLLRQSLALAIFLFGFTLILKKYNKIGLLVILSTILFHSSALLPVIIVYIVYLSIYKSNDPKKIVNYMVLLGIVVFIFFNFLVNIVYNLGIIPSKYNAYLSGDLGVPFSIFSFILKLPVLVLFIWKFNDYIAKSKLMMFLFLMLIYDFIFYQLRISNLVFMRFGYYFFVFQFISVPLILRKIENKYDKNVFAVLYIVFVIFTFYYQIIISGNNEIYPYRSSILNIF